MMRVNTQNPSCDEESTFSKYMNEGMRRIIGKENGYQVDLFALTTDGQDCLGQRLHEGRPIIFYS